MTARKVSRGFVIRIQGADYCVVSGGEEVRCSLRGRLRIGESSEAALPVVGDTVTFRREEAVDSRGPSGMILSVLPRVSVFARSDPAGRGRHRILGANLDHVFLIFSVREPQLNPRLLDRMLVAAECGGMEPVICINKMDLAAQADSVREEMSPYAAVGYDIVCCSAVTGVGLQQLLGRMVGKKSILVGPSGAGKTSIIAAIEPGMDLRIGSVSSRTGKGRHTTTHFELHPLKGGGYLGDSPGVREFGIWGVTKGTLNRYFREFAPFTGHCRFSGCTHSHEPGCAVKEAVRDGSIAQRRYDSYLRILESLAEGGPRQRGGP